MPASACATATLGLVGLFLGADLGASVGDQLVGQAHARRKVGEHSASSLYRRTPSLDCGLVGFRRVSHARNGIDPDRGLRKASRLGWPWVLKVSPFYKGRTPCCDLGGRLAHEPGGGGALVDSQNAKTPAERGLSMRLNGVEPSRPVKDTSPSNRWFEGI
jgi:hypothetical protein